MNACGEQPGLRSVAATLQALLAASAPRPAAETLPLAQAHGRVLLAPVQARVDVPGHDNSAMDGYALRLADLADDRRLPVALTVPAGAAPTTLPAGAAARIFTGAPIPAGADAVVMQEQCEADADGVRLPAEIKPGQNIRRAGEDVRAGSEILAAGVRLRPQELGLLASVGVPAVEVARPLRVALLATGDELTSPGEPLAPGHIYDSNGPMLRALVEALGCEPVEFGRLPDDYAQTRERLAEAAAAADVVITTGGVSVGDEDHVKPAVSALGRLDLWKVAVKPGKPFAFGHIDATPFMGLPGNPVSVFATFMVLARPYLLQLQGQRDGLEPPMLQVPAAFSHDRPDRRREEFLRVRLAVRDGVTVAEAFPHQGSGVLSSVAWADGLVRLAPGQTVQPGDPVPYMAFASLLAGR